MTHNEEIFKAVSDLVTKKGQSIFSRQDVKNQMGIAAHVWAMGYTAVFQGMIENPSEKSLKILPKYRQVFRRVSRGKYTLTPYGRSLLKTNSK